MPVYKAWSRISGPNHRHLRRMRVSAHPGCGEIAGNGGLKSRESFTGRRSPTRRSSRTLCCNALWNQCSAPKPVLPVVVVFVLMPEEPVVVVAVSVRPILEVAPVLVPVVEPVPRRWLLSRWT